MIHISDHIPQAEVEKLIQILRITCVDDILSNLKLAEEWYQELVDEKE